MYICQRQVPFTITWGNGLMQQLQPVNPKPFVYTVAGTASSTDKEQPHKTQQVTECTAYVLSHGISFAGSCGLN